MKSSTRFLFAAICALFVLGFCHTESASARWVKRVTPSGDVRWVWVSDGSGPIILHPSGRTGRRGWPWRN